MTDKIYLITEDELLEIEHGCIHPEVDECIGESCKYYNADISCDINPHDIADNVRARSATSMVRITCPVCGRHQEVTLIDWYIQSTVGHGYTCGSDTCPSHTYMVFDNQF